LIVTVEITAESLETIRRTAELAERVFPAAGAALVMAADTGAQSITAAAITESLGFQVHKGGAGLAGSVFGWMLDASIPLVAVGVPSNTPAVVYARMVNDGGTITPTKAKALAVPISDAAKREKITSPRDMAGLVMIKRKGKPPLLVEQLKSRWIIHWVLVASVTIRPTHWFDAGVEQAIPGMVDAARLVFTAAIFGEYSPGDTKRWLGGMN
jgi:hypothetical protein